MALTAGLLAVLSGSISGVYQKYPANWQVVTPRTTSFADPDNTQIDRRGRYTYIPQGSDDVFTGYGLLVANGSDIDDLKVAYDPQQPFLSKAFIENSGNDIWYIIIFIFLAIVLVLLRHQLNWRRKLLRNVKPRDAKVTYIKNEYVIRGGDYAKYRIQFINESGKKQSLELQHPNALQYSLRGKNVKLYIDPHNTKRTLVDFDEETRSSKAAMWLYNVIDTLLYIR